MLDILQNVPYVHHELRLSLFGNRRNMSAEEYFNDVFYQLVL